MTAQLPRWTDLGPIPMLLAPCLVAGFSPEIVRKVPVAVRLHARSIFASIFPKHGENHDTPAPAPHFAALRIAVVVCAMTGRPAPRLGSESA